MERYICIHGHFYQPPRENPWLEEIEVQDSAYPYHDWNERVTAECYAPNTASRLLGPDKKIYNIVNNYAHISFDFGPTLLSWMQRHVRDVYEDILQADQESQKRFSGHGSALAQVYNHMIMPLANDRDAHTQVHWGIKDFEHRFKRRPEGMWLAETAVNTSILEILSADGIKFTILAPSQAGKIREIGEEKWYPVKGGKIDSQRVYLCTLPSGRTINLFFYDGPISQELAFQDLLRNGENFAKRLIGIFPAEHASRSPADSGEPRLVHVATDGETYGHHRNFGDMALAYCLHYLESNKLAEVTVYGEYLEKFPPTHEVQILENTSWSCAHGVERWRSACGCHSGRHPDWQQKWREPLRSALDGLRDALSPLYEQKMREWTDDPWKIRDNYIEVVLDRSPKNVERFLRQNIQREIADEEKVRILKLLEMQRHAMLMYTSCGWFFDEISGIEATQILQYAARAIQLGRELFGQDLETDFKGILEKAPSNISDYRNGAVIYERLVRPSIVDLPRVGVHYAAASLFKDHGEEKKVYCYTVNSEIHDRKEAGRQKIVVGRCRIRSDITWEEDTVCFAVLHLGDHNLNGGVKSHMEEDAFKGMHQEIKKAFLRSDISEVMRLINHHFGTSNYSLKHLFKDEQERMFKKIVHSLLEDMEAHSRQIYEQYYPLVQAADDLQIPLPKTLVASVAFALNRDLLELLNKEKINMRALERTVEEISRRPLEVDKETVGFVASQKINILMQRLYHDPRDLNTLKSVEALLRVLSPLSLNLDLWKAQNAYFAISTEFLSKPRRNEKEKEMGVLPPPWVELFKSLGDYLQVRSQ